MMSIVLKWFEIKRARC